ncbi:hypothetical protein C8D88_11612 [Lentzea atacamensis]|uniref:Glycosyl hydrolase-like 10 domain-containing protein n=1 Tax=Lentzea atacamensis TaxID=531938 RepID=A0A316HTL0_9PSEU|nr:hypothetical protein [Lentzea atacamensis]PWK81602.1 hypothetical protein C8D88_11612 [Lentzea atacamensis]
MRRVICLLLVAALLIQPGVATADQGSISRNIRGWTILSDSDAGADEVIASAKRYRINHLQLSHDVVHDLREVRDPRRQAQVNRLTDLAHTSGIREVAAWDHALYNLAYYPAEFRTGPNGTIDLDNPAFWEWFKADYRQMLDLVPDVDSIILTFVETGARVENQHSTRLKTAEEKLAHLVDQVASVIDERGMLLYLRTFGYYPAEMERTIGAIDRVRNQRIRVMAKAQPHDFFLTHPIDVTVPRIKRPVLIEYDTAGEYNGQGKIANAFVAEHADRLRHYRKLPNVIGYVARTDRYDESRIVNTPTEINLFALKRASEGASNSRIYFEFAARKYGLPAAPHVARALARSPEIITSTLYTLGSNSANHSRLDYDPYCSSYHRSVSGKWVDPPETFVRHGVNKRFHYWIDVANHLAPPHCKTDGVLRREAGYVLDRGWVTPGNLMTQEYLDHLNIEKNHGVNLAKASLRDVERVRKFLRPNDYTQLKSYFERTVLTAELHRAVAKAYFGYRIYVQQPSTELARSIWDGLDEAQAVAARVRAYPAPPTGEWNWVIDAAQADLYLKRISEGWDRYSNIKVQRPVFVGTGR